MAGGETMNLVRGFGFLTQNLWNTCNQESPKIVINPKSQMNFFDV